MVGNQPPAPLLLHPHPGEASLLWNRLALVFPIHRRPPRFHRRVSINAHFDALSRYGLELQPARGEIRKNLRLGSHRAAWPYTDEIICIQTVKCDSVRVNLRLDAFLIELAYKPLKLGLMISSRFLELYDKSLKTC